MNTPEAFANFSPGLERKREPWDIIFKSRPTLKGLGGWRTLSGFHHYYVLIPGLSLRSNPGLKLANASGVILVNFNLMHYYIVWGDSLTRLSG
jgi:hypothetical protein